MERDLTAWLGNHMQNDAVTVLYGLEKNQEKKDAGGARDVEKASDVGPPVLHVYKMVC